jgi:hypothetical protein
MASQAILESEIAVQKAEIARLQGRVGYYADCYKTAVNDCRNAVDAHKQDMHDAAELIMEMSRQFSTKSPIWVSATRWLASASGRGLIDKKRVHPRIK